jgi:Bacterial type II/III secretion system short domain
MLLYPTRLLCLFGLTALLWQAQEPQAPRSTETKVTQVIRLKTLQASEMTRVLRELFTAPERRAPRITVAADDRTNSLVVSAEPNDLATVQKLIASLEKEAAQRPPAHELRVFDLKHTEPDAAMEQALRLIFGPGQAGNFALDLQRRMVICSGDRTALDAAEALLTRLDDRSAQATGGGKAGERRVRLVWLVDTTGAEGGGPAQLRRPPDDLNEVVAELAKLGISKVGLAAQTVANVTEGQSFRIEGTTDLSGGPCYLQVSGVLSQGQEKPTVRIELRATRETPAGKDPASGRVLRRGDPVCSLDTTVTAPPGHAVVLGVTPTAGLTSIFVVQVLPREAPKPRR